MPDIRKKLFVEPETHKEFMDFAKKCGKTQDSGVRYLVKFHKSVGRADKGLADKIHFNLS